MRSFTAMIRSNRAAFGMLAFTLIVYLFLFAVGRAAEKSVETPETQIQEKLSKEELKQKEEAFKENIRRYPALAGFVTLAFLLVLFAGIGLDAYFAIRKFRGLPGLKGQATETTVAWGLGEVAHLFIFLFFMEALIVFVELVTASFVDLLHWNKDAILMGNSFLRNTGAALWVIARVAGHFRAPLASIGLTTRSFWKNVKIGMVGYLAVIPPLLGTLAAMAWVAQLFSYEPEPQTIVQIYLKSSSDNYLLYFTLFVALVGPVIEEIFFRGFTYTAFRHRWGVKWALVGSSGLFALMHLDLITFFPIFVLGIFLAYLYEKTGSLVPSMVVHVTHNFLMVSATLFFKGVAA